MELLYSEVQCHCRQLSSAEGETVNETLVVASDTCRIGEPQHAVRKPEKPNLGGIFRQPLVWTHSVHFIR